MARGTARRIDMLLEFLRLETTGGRLLLPATAVALVWANLPGGIYQAFWSWSPPPSAVLDALHLDLPLAAWVTDGLLTVFFFVAGLTVGELAGWRAAAPPVAAALGGMAVPAVVMIVVSGGAAVHHGAWAIPVATDIAFALDPVSAGVVVPVFALAAAGDALGDRVAWGAATGLLFGTPAGILLGAGLAVWARLGAFPPEVRRGDVLPVTVLGGVGYTASLLIVRLSVPDAAADAAAAAVLCASVVAAILATVMVHRRGRTRSP
ncbi:Na+/H+ antiporter NhaA [Dactylosporangium aurantiacum]|uniref:Na+/H+ antiporter NhaA n=1 Tax=Dactylosporangium aurantiacum TaxID=35754 RepID=A0A9Q9IKP9_9ACTN|nr:Na+/H+ antiporter NhaA [Dactylosporangium aurantiacum]MDG6110462.1 Na+/H+ antiporter NhaA [Dactylosporangium aurantiacum]UWZ56628.1 Na+/H+ antiporter NhaA [Dactylosporangium aurantiacum]